jgi:hypothetical protein
MAEKTYLHIRPSPAEKEKMRRKNLNIFLRPWRKKCRKQGHITFSFVGFLAKQMNW